MVDFTTEFLIVYAYRQLKMGSGSVPSTRAIALVVDESLSRRQITYVLNRHGLPLGPPSRRRKFTREQDAAFLAEFLTGTTSLGRLAESAGVHKKTMRLILERANGGVFPRINGRVVEYQPDAPVIRRCRGCGSNAVNAYFCKPCQRKNASAARGALA